MPRKPIHQNFAGFNQGDKQAIKNKTTTTMFVITKIVLEVFLTEFFAIV